MKKRILTRFQYDFCEETAEGFFVDNRLYFGFPTWAIIALSIIGLIVNPENILRSVGFLYGFISGLMSFIPFIRQILSCMIYRRDSISSINIGFIEDPPIVAHRIST